jgi:ATPase family associated with various cellular activities (AAA)
MNAFAQAAELAPSLGQALDGVYGALLRALPPETAAAETRPRPEDLGQPCTALGRLQTIFELSPFERDVLLLCAGASLESRFLSACAAAHKNAQMRWPTFGLALQTLDAPHWSALSRNRPLRYWRLLELDAAPLLHAPLRLDERILQFLIGVHSADERLEALIRPLRSGELPGADGRSSCNALPEQARAVEAVVRCWKNASAARQPVLLSGGRPFARQSLFTDICRAAGLRAFALNAADIPTAPAEREQLARMWTRESALATAALYVRTENLEHVGNLSAWLELVEAPVGIEAALGSAAEKLEGLRVHLAPMSAEKRRKLWTEALGSVAPAMDGALDRIVEHFQFDEPDIQISGAVAREEALADGVENPGDLTWRVCREHSRRSLENLAQRIETKATWADLVLPAAQTETLRQIAIHVRQRSVVNDQWGFAARYSRGLGLSALFSGSSGTGKTMAAEILASELALDLYRIDLSCVVSKYIGETEKNLRKIFDAAEDSGAILLFDEADALFGKRSEVRDSHDRYANLEISYLLQRIDTYRGVAILTTNMQHAIDAAFMRRIRFIVPFPFPDAAARELIWQRIFPAATPLGALAFERLAQLNVSGGVIRNIAMHAAFLAAEEKGAVRPAHVLAAAHSEYSKLEKPLTAAETRGWL